MRAVTVVLSMILLSSSPKVAGSATPAKARRKAPAFVLSNANGSRVRLSDYKGKVVVLDFWATWCTGCKVEIPWFMEFQDKYKSMGLETIGAAMDDEGWEKVRPYVDEHPFNYPIVAGNAAALAKTFNITGLPLTMLIDRKGRIVDAHVGVVEKDAWEAEVRAALEERPR
jgi:cytochrome c biogenesis protein CcmG/thiol:disulfide interchange protein DsbE